MGANHVTFIRIALLKLVAFNFQVNRVFLTIIYSSLSMSIYQLLELISLHEVMVSSNLKSNGTRFFERKIILGNLVKKLPKIELN